MQSELTISDIIQIVGILMSLLTSIIAIIISVISLRQNSKTIKETFRPYVTIYFEAMQLGTPMGYFVVKNFGQNSARIIDCSYNDAIRNNKQTIADLRLFFDNLINVHLAPGQKYVIPCRLSDFHDDVAIFTLIYGDEIIQYTEHVRIHVSNYKKYIKPRFVSNNENKNISYPLQEIAEKLL